MPILNYQTHATRTLSTGEKRTYIVVQKYEVKGPKWTPEQIAEMKQKVADGVKKSRIMADYKISRATLNKYIAG